MAKSARTILAIDPGEKTGWAVIRGGKPVVWGRWTSTRWPMTAVLPAMIVAKAVEFGATELAYERVGHHMSSAAAHAWGSNRALVEQAAYTLQVPLQPVDQATVKKRATGSGKAKKPQMVDAANVLLQQHACDPVRTEDEADAIWVGMAAWDTPCPT